jgi:hypothetical protein
MRNAAVPVWTAPFSATRVRQRIHQTQGNERKSNAIHQPQSRISRRVCSRPVRRGGARRNHHHRRDRTGRQWGVPRIVLIIQLVIGQWFELHQCVDARCEQWERHLHHHHHTHDRRRRQRRTTAKCSESKLTSLPALPVLQFLQVVFSARSREQGSSNIADGMTPLATSRLRSSLLQVIGAFCAAPFLLLRLDLVLRRSDNAVPRRHTAIAEV